MSSFFSRINIQPILILSLILQTVLASSRGHPTDKFFEDRSAAITNCPWMGSLLYGDAKFFFCGATLIANQWILTSAHCVNELHETQLKVRLGSSYHYTGGTLKTVSLIKVHPNFRDSNFYSNDIALVKLNSPVIYGTTIYPVGLPNATTFTNVVGLRANITGYGTTSKGGSYSDTLRAATVNIMDPSNCTKSYADSYNTTLNLCAAAPGRDACQGDSGGPLSVTDSNGFTYQIGIISWGYGCADINYPGVYIKVSQYTNWIWTTISNN